MSAPTPRFEFRAFAQHFGRVAERLRERSCPPAITESTERYLIAAGAHAHNVKIRRGTLEIKALVERRGRLERWAPTAAQAFPLSAHFVTSTLLPVLGVDALDGAPGHLRADALLDALAWPRHPVWVAFVFKRRYRFRVDECPAELDEVLVNGGAVRSLAAECTDADALAALVDGLGLGDYENVSYPRAIRRLTGLEAWPCETFPGRAHDG